MSIPASQERNLAIGPLRQPPRAGLVLSCTQNLCLSSMLSPLGLPHGLPQGEHHHVERTVSCSRDNVKRSLVPARGRALVPWRGPQAVYCPQVPALAVDLPVLGLELQRRLEGENRALMGVCVCLSFINMPSHAVVCQR